MTLPPANRPASYNGLIQNVFSKVPFEGDMTENETVLKFAFKLW